MCTREENITSKFYTDRKFRKTHAYVVWFFLKQYIYLHIKVQSGQPAQLQRLRRNINSCFPDIDGFLLPFPGETVAHDEIFSGNVAGKIFLKILHFLCFKGLFQKNANTLYTFCSTCMII